MNLIEDVPPAVELIADEMQPEAAPVQEASRFQIIDENVWVEVLRDQVSIVKTTENVLETLEIECHEESDNTTDAIEIATDAHIEDEIVTDLSVESALPITIEENSSVDPQNDPVDDEIVEPESISVAVACDEDEIKENEQETIHPVEEIVETSSSATKTADSPKSDRKVKVMMTSVDLDAITSIPEEDTSETDEPK